MTWLEDVINALEALGGIASYSDIYGYIQKHSNRRLPSSWKAIIRAIIERNSSDSKLFAGKKDLFYSVEGIGKGIWGLREKLTPTPSAEDLGDVKDNIELPERVKTEIYRVLRDTNLTKKMKQLYNNRCQICGNVIKLKDGKEYSEAHHIKPLGKHDGPDSADNIIILCPNHHVEFDYGVIAIDPENFTVLHKNPNNSYLRGKIYIHPSHKLNKEFLRFHLKMIYNVSNNKQICENNK